MAKYIFTVVVLIFSNEIIAQFNLSGKVLEKDATTAVIGATIYVNALKKGTVTDVDGNFTLKLPAGNHELKISSIGFSTQIKKIALDSDLTLDFTMTPDVQNIEEVVVSGTMKEMTKMASPVPVDIISPKFLFKNPTPSIFEALQNVNGVRPQINCNVCSTGDIHINGLEGPYTMVLIDGMPIVSSLSTVYGLSGIPNSLIERVEVVKGAASTLYGSEALGGLINIITKNAKKAPILSFDSFATTWGEVNTDLAVKFKISPKINVLTGLNSFHFNNRIDLNNDNFTDLTLQKRISLFNKISIERPQNREASLAVRLFYEDRLGGEINWKPENRGGSDVYAESIYTKRFELIGNYQLPVKEKVTFQYSYNYHNQNSYYGTTAYMATQQIAFGQLVWNKTFLKHDLLTGIPFRYTFYDDNSPATLSNDGKTNQPDHIKLPGIFVQDNFNITPNQILLLGMRYDYNSTHGNIFTPRFAYKLSDSKNLNVVRFNVGRGYRVVNLFTEDHAALSGARKVVIAEELKPEQSWNTNINYVKKVILNNGFIGIDASVFYTYFSNQILPDYTTNVNQIIYKNLNGHAISKGASLNLDFSFDNGLKILAGVTKMDVSKFEKEVKTRQLLTERFSGTWAVSYEIPKLNINVDYTGNITGPMLLPTLGPLDPRPTQSPTWSIQNVQLSRKFKNGLEIYGGVKNLLNFRPYKSAPFLIARANDPFDKNVEYTPNGEVMVTQTNPYALTFDPNYVYASQQGIRGFLGLRYVLQ
jgi:outer membrane receptor for ferrienterochelin and colicins